MGKNNVYLHPHQMKIERTRISINCWVGSIPAPKKYELLECGFSVGRATHSALSEAGSQLHLRVRCCWSELSAQDCPPRRSDHVENVVQLLPRPGEER